MSPARARSGGFPALGEVLGSLAQDSSPAGQDIIKASLHFLVGIWVQGIGTNVNPLSSAVAVSSKVTCL